MPSQLSGKNAEPNVMLSFVSKTIEELNSTLDNLQTILLRWQTTIGPAFAELYIAVDEDIAEQVDQWFQSVQRVNASSAGGNKAHSNSTKRVRDARSPCN